MNKLILLLILFSKMATAQISDFESVFAQTKEVIKQDAVWLSAEYQLYPTHTSQEITSTADCKTYFSEDLYNQSIEGVHTIIEDNKIIICDANEQVIVVDSYKGDILRTIFSIDLEQMSEFITSVSSKEINNAFYYTLNIQSSEIEKLDLQINKASFHYEKIVMYYAYAESLGDDISQSDNPRLELLIDPYSHSDKRPWTIEKNPFVKLDDKQVIPLSQYSKYSIVNNLNQL